MNKIKNKIALIFKEKKTTIIFFVILLLVGIIFGTIFTTILDKSDKELVQEQIQSFFTNSKSNTNNDILSALKNSLFSNILTILSIWLLGLSIIGIPLILIIIFIKGFILGFSIGGIISTYNIKGIILSLGYIFPHNIINLIVILILSVISFNISINFLKALLTKKSINFKEWINKYYKFLIYSLIIIISSSIMEVFLSPYIIKLVANLI